MVKMLFLLLDLAEFGGRTVSSSGTVGGELAFSLATIRRRGDTRVRLRP
jgi:hypothetical protein